MFLPGGKSISELFDILENWDIEKIEDVLIHSHFRFRGDWCFRDGISMFSFERANKNNPRICDRFVECIFEYRGKYAGILIKKKVSPKDKQKETKTVKLIPDFKAAELAAAPTNAEKIAEQNLIAADERGQDDGRFSHSEYYGI